MIDEEEAELDDDNNVDGLRKNNEAAANADVIEVAAAQVDRVKVDEE